MDKVEQIKAEIKRRLKIHAELLTKPEMSDLRKEINAKDDTLHSILSFIDSLPTYPQESDNCEELEKEIESYLDGFIKNPTRTYFRDAIRHFYELGLNAKKEGEL